MIRCVKTSFKTDGDDLDRLFQCNRLSAQIWNDCLSVSKTFALSHDGKWIGKAFRVEGNNLYLSMGIENGKRRKPIKLRIAKLPPYPIKEIELICDRKLMLSISYDDGIKPSENTNTNKCAVDLGEIHSIASYCCNGGALIITGRKQRSVHRLRNKKLAELQKLMSKCTKGSRQWKK